MKKFTYNHSNINKNINLERNEKFSKKTNWKEKNYDEKKITKIQVFFLKKNTNK